VNSRAIVVGTRLWALIVFELHPGTHALSDEDDRRRGRQRRAARLDLE
jgi:hypothetical protein